MGKVTEVFLPDIGDFAEVDVIEILVSPGDQVAAEDSLLTLESEKATMEIPAPFAGVVSELKVAVGQKVNQGQLILLMETAEDDASAGAGEAPAAVPAEPPPAPASVAEPPPAPPAAEPAASAATEIKDIPLPELGDFHDVEVIEVLVKPGDRVAVEDSLLTLESEKATMEIPSPEAGVIESVLVSTGDRVNQGQLIVRMQVEGATPAPAPAAPAAASAAAPAPANPPAAAPASPSAPPPAPASRAPGDKTPRQRPVIAKPSDAPKGRAHASPAVRRFARELGVDLMRVKGTANKGRITKEDVQTFVKQSLAAGAEAPAGTAGGGFSLPAAPEIDFSQFGTTETVALGRIKKLSGAHLHRSWVTVPHVTQFDEADITELEAFRKAQKAALANDGVRLTLIPFLMKALCGALRAFPQFNASLAPDGEHLILKQYLHIGVAVDTPNGLLVPVVRDVDSKGITALARELGELSERARNGKLMPADLQGGCISISSLGGIGGTQFTPIVNQPEVAILGVSKAQMQPRWDGAAFQPRLIMPFSLSYDHRVIDGAEGVRFTRYLVEALGDIRRLLL